MIGENKMSFEELDKIYRERIESESWHPQTPEQKKRVEENFKKAQEYADKMKEEKKNNY